VIKKEEYYQIGENVIKCQNFLLSIHRREKEQNKKEENKEVDINANKKNGCNISEKRMK